MMKYNKTRNRLVGGMYKYVDEIVTRAMRQNKKLVIWGCGKGGAFLTHLIHDIDGRITVTSYIDEHIVLPCGNCQYNIFRSSLLWYISPDEYTILLSIRKDDAVERMLEKCGFEKNKDYYDVRSDIGGNYLEYLEMNNCNVDFAYVTKEDRPDLYSGDYFESKPFDHSSVDHLFEEICTLPCEKTFLDIGCGKGQILMMAAMSDMKKIGGIEWNSQIAETAKCNMNALQINADIVAGDATEYRDIDGYSIFFLYNPFGEQGIRQVTQNICESFRRRKRDIFFVYGNPFYHKTVMSIKEVQLHRQVRVDLYDPLLNIYKIQG